MNHLEITSDKTVTYLTVKLNGVKIDHLISMKAEIPSGNDTPLIKVSLEFYSALDADLYVKELSRADAVISLEHPSIPSSDTETDFQNAQIGSSLH